MCRIAEVAGVATERVFFFRTLLLALLGTECRRNNNIITYIKTKAQWLNPELERKDKKESLHCHYASVEDENLNDISKKKGGSRFSLHLLETHSHSMG